ncbi:MAG: hypothetical protein KJS68_00050 [Alphaproteobacteria bacterium]|nr:hypothetical protein [Alphaproteobacteria bacterium]MDE2494696.1 hypothetical protein [Alphaproteobacteria bacterium]
MIDKRVALSVLLSLMLAACGRSQSASPANIQAALQAYYDRHPACISLALTLPAEIDVDGFEPMRPQLQALTKIGLLVVAPVRPAEGQAPSATPVAQQIRYRIAPRAGKFVHKGRDSFMGGTDLCFANRKVTKVISIGTPAKVMGRTVSQVRYDVILANIVPWAYNSTILEAFPALKTALSQPSGSRTETMVLTHQGWQLERDARQQPGLN